MSLGMGDGQPANPYDMFLQMLETHFTPKISIVFEQHKFFSRVHGYDEDVLTYVAALRGLAVTCDFQNLNDSLIRDQIVRCTNSKKVKERLLSIDPSLEECIQIVRSMEHTETWMKEIEVKSHVRDSDKENTVEVKEFKVKKQGKNPGNKRSMVMEKKNPNILCYRCGGLGHIASSPLCIARTLTCRVCGIGGHLAKVCRSKGKVLNNSVKSVDDAREEQEEIVLTVNSVLEVNQRNVECKTGRNLRKESTIKLEKPHCDIILESKSVRVLVDSGSLFTLISKDVYVECLERKVEDLQAADVKAVGYGGNKINILGMKWMDILFKGNGVHGKVYVTSEGSNLLGWRHQKDLEIVLDPNAVEPVMTVEKAYIEHMDTQESGTECHLWSLLWCLGEAASFYPVSDSAPFALQCKHVLAIYLSQALGACQERSVSDKQLSQILLAREDDE
ncbi:hypothetical protein NDU88_002813 [Pleurodeles waltl]|uniref:CCHC-type domain-containing protein n=1 Tax=Pleurodeles waltl TaxID=8319 RepID=A0AAV7UAY6_PLEWA|nr:hypothetical protein NDU88_002813 [Pleurodeles waltl]